MEVSTLHNLHSNLTSCSDGSVEADLPMDRLSELFNINHFIVSQVCFVVSELIHPLTIYL